MPGACEVYTVGAHDLVGPWLGVTVYKHHPPQGVSDSFSLVNHDEPSGESAPISTYVIPRESNTYNVEIVIRVSQ